MNHRVSIQGILLTMILFVLLLLTRSLAALGQTTAPAGDVPRTISYQGLLSRDGIPFGDGEYQLTVTLYGDQEGTQPVWIDAYTAQVTGGVFNLLLGQNNPLPRPERMNRPLWIGTSVNGREMRPLAPLTASPYALNVPDNAITAGKLADGAVTAEKLGTDYISEVRINGEKVSARGSVLNLIGTPSVPLSYDEATQSVTIGKIAAQTGDREKGTSPLANQDQVWSANGDGWDIPANAPYIPVAGDWIGTSAASGVDFVLQANGQQAMVYQQNGGGILNIIGADASNIINAPLSQGSIIAGGAANTINIGDYNTVSGGQNNVIAPGGGWITGVVIAGGENNAADADYTVVGGGRGNYVQSNFSTIGGGRDNTIDPNIFESTIGGGYLNYITAPQGTIAGGYTNQVHGYLATVGGGKDNIISAGQSLSTISGGLSNRIDAINAVIGGGVDNNIVTGADYASIGGGHRNVLQGAYSAAPGGDQLRTAASYAQTAVGFYNDDRGASMPNFPSAAQIAASNEPLFIVGNGDVNVSSGRSNAFEVAYNGHSKVFNVNGSGAVNPALEGATYVDNVVYAWANVAANGAINSDFGISNIAHVAGSGIYTVTFNYMNQYTGSTTLNDVAVTATIHGNVAGAITAVIPAGPTTTFTIRTYTVGGVLADRAFMFHMTGRP